MTMDDNQTFQDVVGSVGCSTRSRTHRAAQVFDQSWSHDDWEPSRPDSTRWISYIM